MAKAESVKNEDPKASDKTNKQFYFYTFGIVLFGILFAVIVYLIFSPSAKNKAVVPKVDVVNDIVVNDEDHVLPGAVLRLPQLLINLKNNTGVLEIKATLSLYDLEKPEGITSFEGFYVDKIISLASSYSSDELVKNSYKKELKKKLLESFNSSDRYQIVDVYFEEFHIRNY